MALWIQISTGSSDPVYAQLISQISKAIAEGRLRTGDKLPAVRKLASELVINPNTVAKAYMHLEQSKLVVTKTGSGTYVADNNQRTVDAADMNILIERMDNIISRAINLGMEQSGISDMFNSRLDKFYQNKRNVGEKND